MKTDGVNKGEHCRAMNGGGPGNEPWGTPEADVLDIGSLIFYMYPSSFVKVGRGYSREVVKFLRKNVDDGDKSSSGGLRRMKTLR